ncbi:MAG: O-antigen ligase family protein [Planctomycetes bacterium]|jgi:O-antigen ligase|nr:O-antigen ligase family protein [Planctomycetota bacterium]
MADRLALLALLLWLLLAPIPFGSVPGVRTVDGAPPEGLLAEGYTLFRSLGLLVLALALPAVLARGGGLSPRGRTMLLLAAALPALALLQLLPVPMAVHRFLAPGHATDLAILSPPAGFAPVAVDPGLTSRAALFLALLAGAALATARLARSARAGAVLLAGLATVAAAMALAEAVAPGLPLGLLGAEGLGDVGATGTFVYRGTFAAFVAMALGISAAGFVAGFCRRLPLLAALSAMASAALVAGLLVCRSRAGLAAGVLAAAVGAAASVRSRAVKVAAGCLAGAVLLGAILFLPGLRERFCYLAERPAHGFLDIRVPVWRSALDLVPGRPVLGTGLGGFERAIHLTQSDRVPEEIFFAHSEPLNLLVEGGVVGLLLGGALVLLGFLGALGRARSGEPGPAAIGAACAGGLAGLLAMALVDFPLSIPATALSATVLLFLPGAAAGPLTAPRPAHVACAALAVLVAIGSFVFRDRLWPGEREGFRTRGEVLASEGAGLYAERRTSEAAKTLARARDAQPFEAATRYFLALSLVKENRAEEGQRELLSAWHLARGRAELLWRIGWFAWKKDWPFAAAAFREAAALHPQYLNRVFAELTPEILPRAVPDRDYAFETLSAWHRGRGEMPEAIEAAWRVFDLNGSEGALRTVAALYRAVGQEEAGRLAFDARGLEWPEGR